jgi:hypothetical protein
MNDLNATGVIAMPRGPLLELALYFPRFGTIGFGGLSALCGQREKRASASTTQTPEQTSGGLRPNRSPYQAAVANLNRRDRHNPNF